MESPDTKLESLDLSCNELSDAGVTNIVAALTVNESMKSLNLGSNRITDIGLDALYCCLIQSNENITWCAEFPIDQFSLLLTITKFSVFKLSITSERTAERNCMRVEGSWHQLAEAGSFQERIAKAARAV